MMNIDFHEVCYFCHQPAVFTAWVEDKPMALCEEHLARYKDQYDEYLLLLEDFREEGDEQGYLDG